MQNSLSELISTGVVPEETMLLSVLSGRTTPQRFDLLVMPTPSNPPGQCRRYGQLFDWVQSRRLFLPTTSALLSVALRHQLEDLKLGHRICGIETEHCDSENVMVRIYDFDDHPCYIMTYPRHEQIQLQTWWIVGVPDQSYE